MRRRTEYVGTETWISLTAPGDAGRLDDIPELGLRALVTNRELPELLRPGDVMVVNDTRVVPARLRARRGDAAVELLLNRPGAEGWHALARNARRLRPATP